LRYLRIKKIEEKFPDFLRDVASAINSGMPLPKAVKHVARNDYGVLSKYVRKFATQIDWGVPFNKALLNFAEATESRVVKRAISAILETHRSGGKIAETLVSVVKSLTEIEKLKKERAAAVYQQIVNGYIIFFVFVGTMVAMTNFLLPSLKSMGIGSFSQISSMSEMSYNQTLVEEQSKKLVSAFREMFLYMTVIQGIFSGLVIGKMAEGSLTAGVKHSVIMAIIGYLAFTVL
jgi:flagellar protein FlaJ